MLQLNTSLNDLAKEYDRSVEIQKQAIETNRKKLFLARKKGDFGEMRRLSSLLRVLYDEKSELEEKANTLRNYYS